MHELALANEICAIVEREVGRAYLPGTLAQVTTVVVEVGLTANVEPASLQFCLDALLATPPFGRGCAVLQRVPGDDLRVGWFELEDEADGPSADDPFTLHLAERTS